jgi:hypothetical protein
MAEKENRVSVMITSDSELNCKDVERCCGEALRKVYGPASVMIPKYIRFSKKYDNFIVTIDVQTPKRTFESSGMKL